MKNISLFIPAGQLNRLPDIARELAYDEVRWNEKTLRIIWSVAGKPLLQIRLPLFYDYTVRIMGKHVTVEANNQWDIPLLVLLISSGYAALGVRLNNEWLEHTSIQKYMTRKSQGKSQMTYLNKKGKSRLGSRIRLKQSREFVEEIIAISNDWNSIYKFEKIVYSAPPVLWGALFSHVPAPFWDRKDEKLFKLPLYHNKPNFSEMDRLMNMGRRVEMEMEWNLWELLKNRIENFSEEISDGS